MSRFYQILCAPFAFVHKYFKSFIFILIVVVIWLSFSSDNAPKALPNLAKIELTGPIISAENIYLQIKKIKSQESIKGVFLVINSPGGLVAPSVEISDLIKELASEIPVVAYVSGLMASGSYYGGMHATKIIANRGSMIGSIGVIFSQADLSELMKKVGIKNQTITAGAYKEVGTPFREWNQTEKKFLEDLIQQQYGMFVSDVANARKLNALNYKDFAEGKIFNAQNALNLGLIDKLGSYDSAILELQNLSNVKDPVWYVPNKPSFYEEIISKLGSIISTQILNALSAKIY